MGSGADDYQKRHSHNQQLHAKYKLKMLVLVILTNLLTIYIFAGPSLILKLPSYTNHIPFPIWDSNHLLQELNSTKQQLATSYLLLDELHHKLNSTNLLVQALLMELSKQPVKDSDDNNDKFIIDGFSDEVMLAIAPHKLPLGYSPRTGSDEVYPPVGAGCLRYQEELTKCMSYEIGGECPVDDVFANRLMLRGYNSIIWDPYTCKNYKCLIDRKNAPGYYDCKDCFDLQGREKKRWMLDNGGLDYGIDQVVKVKPQGSIRIGLDIGGGTGTFAARMKERNITIITSTMNLDGPFNSFIASRGLIPIHLSVSQKASILQKHP
ncbi:hypothetical protein JCGZ_13380 [Jatropha curcas]|uniref:Methyltransferase n=1 Tax=Jatropha curcas TaxID=180498 RepID=A0A067KJL4_JATCU|nr:hypothetical protein JCGZ_13380 [Jatropha curcas]